MGTSGPRSSYGGQALQDGSTPESSGCSVKAHNPEPTTRSTEWAKGPDIGAWIESKARATLDKSDVAVFHLKCFDLYREAASEYPEQTAKARWWPTARVFGAD